MSAAARWVARLATSWVASSDTYIGIQVKLVEAARTRAEVTKANTYYGCVLTIYGWVVSSDTLGRRAMLTT